MRAARALLLLALSGAIFGGTGHEFERTVFAAINRQRTAAGAGALAWDEALAREARSHSTRMRDLGFFAHRDPERGTVAQRLTRTGVPWSRTAENIYMAQGYRRPDLTAVQSWLRSPSHRRNLLGRVYTRTGIGAASGPNNTWYFTQIFAR